MSDKRKFPRAKALDVAKVLCDALKPVTTRLIVAGSLRRRKELVGDVEIVFVPKVEVLPSADLFGGGEPVVRNLADEVIEGLVRDGVLRKRLSREGRPAWGAKNKLALHANSLMPVDLFMSTEESWFNYLVCRTGPLESNVAIAAKAQELGWKWNPYGDGFSRPTVPTREVRVMGSEREVFEFVGMEYKEPWER
jgi:DNA polymerase/3'-5' exonuclease PolX